MFIYYLKLAVGSTACLLFFAFFCVCVKRNAVFIYVRKSIASHENHNSHCYLAQNQKFSSVMLIEMNWKCCGICHGLRASRNEPADTFYSDISATFWRKNLLWISWVWTCTMGLVQFAMSALTAKYVTVLLDFLLQLCSAALLYLYIDPQNALFAYYGLPILCAH